jgi:Protein of unknown function (DUF3373)
MKKFLLYVAMILLLTAGMAAAADETLLEIGADYRVRYDILKGNVHEYISSQPGQGAMPATKTWNNSMMLDRLGLNLKANVTEDLTVKTRLLQYKVWGHQTSQPYQGSFFADRAAGVFDGTIGHVPNDSTLRVDYAYATLSNIGGSPLWLSAGRRPSTGGVPSNLRQNLEKTGSAGVPSIMIDYAFDGATAGFSPAIEALPGAFAKLCYGKGFDSGYNDVTKNNLKDTDFLGINIVPYDTDNLVINLEIQKGFNIADQPSDIAPIPNVNQSLQNPDPTVVVPPPSTNVGNISWWGGVIMGKVSDLNLFFSVAQSRSDPNNQNAAGVGLLSDANNPPEASRLVGTAIYVGGRYDIKSTGTKIGLEYNQGSKYWIGMVPAADDVWTSKLGTRGRVYEVYIIQELKNRPLMKKAKAFWKVGYQIYDFKYTGSNNWMGAPIKISDLDQTNAANAQFLAPIKKATDLYMTFEVLF